MSRGTFVAVVGPSGSGKDTLMRAALERRPELMAARRVIARPPDDASEAFESVDGPEFARRRAAGAFALDWAAHGTRYAIPAAVEDALADGRHVLANLSREVVPAARARFAPFRAIVVAAPVEALAERLALRGRESAAAIRARLTRAGFAAPQGRDVVQVDNAGALADGVAAFLAALPPQPARP